MCFLWCIRLVQMSVSVRHPATMFCLMAPSVVNNEDSNLGIVYSFDVTATLVAQETEHVKMTTDGLT